LALVGAIEAAFSTLRAIAREYKLNDIDPKSGFAIPDRPDAISCKQ
jgi:hypothetical protein